MAGSLMTMPMLIVNMGAEMIYVLDQRLKAQNIPRDKSSKGMCERTSECRHALTCESRGNLTVRAHACVLQCSKTSSRRCTMKSS